MSSTAEQGWIQTARGSTCWLSWVDRILGTAAIVPFSPYEYIVVWMNWKEQGQTGIECQDATFPT